MHHVRSHGAPKITMRSDDYNAKLRSAKKDKTNAFIAGVQDVYENKGAGDAVKESKDSLYGAPNVSVGRVLQGDRHSNFEQPSAPGNQVADDPYNQTGDLALQTSQTKSPQRDPEEVAESTLDSQALERRLAMYKEASNAYFSNNRRDQTMRLS